MLGNVIPQGFKIKIKPVLGDSDPILDRAWNDKLDRCSHDLVEITCQRVELTLERLNNKWEDLEKLFNDLPSPQDKKQQMAECIL